MKCPACDREMYLDWWCCYCRRFINQCNQIKWCRDYRNSTKYDGLIGFGIIVLFVLFCCTINFIKSKL